MAVPARSKPKRRAPHIDIKEAEGDKAKLDFLMAALRDPDPFADDLSVDPELVEINDWLASRDPASINAYRRNVTARIEKACTFSSVPPYRVVFMPCHCTQINRESRDSGKAAAWFKGCDNDIYEVRNALKHIFA